MVRSSTAALSLQGFRRVEPVDDPEPDGLGAARRVGLRHRAQAVLSIDLRTGEARDEGGGLWSATASAAVTLYRIDGDDERVHDAVHEVRGFAETREDAVLAAIEAACERSWTRLADRVLPAEYREVRVEVLDIPEFAEFERVQELLAAQGWVEDVRVDPVGYHPRKTVFFVRGRQDAVLLGASLDRWPELEVVQAGTGGLLVRFVR